MRASHHSTSGMGSSGGCCSAGAASARTPSGIRLASPAAAAAASALRRSASCRAAPSPYLACAIIVHGRAGRQAGGQGEQVLCGWREVWAGRQACGPGLAAAGKVGSGRPPGQELRHSGASGAAACRRRRAHPQPADLGLLLQLALLHKSEGGAGAALHAAQPAVAQARIKEPAEEGVGVGGST